MNYLVPFGIALILLGAILSFWFYSLQLACDAVSALCPERSSYIVLGAFLAAIGAFLLIGGLREKPRYTRRERLSV